MTPPSPAAAVAGSEISIFERSSSGVSGFAIVMDLSRHPEERSDEGSAFATGATSRSLVAPLLGMTKEVAATSG